MLLAAWFLIACCVGAWANPTGPVVTQGSASFSTSGSQLIIRPSDRAYINWQSFNIAVGETTTFVQPSSSSLVWNHINDPNPSQILGSLNANGYVVLQNQSGFYIGGQACLSAHGLLLTTLAVNTPDLSGSGEWQFNAQPPTANIINYGKLQSDTGGSVFLIGEHIENHGAISAPGGEIGLYAGKQVMVSERPDGRGLSAQVTLPGGSVDNTGNLIADAGAITVHAQVVNQGGLVQANSVRDVNGIIELVASDSLNLADNSVISAKGDSTSAGPSAGGFVTLKSGNTFSDTALSSVDVSGAVGGQGGIVEVFFPHANAAAIHSTINNPFALLFNPFDLSISDNPTDTSSSNPNFNKDDLLNYSRISLQALDNIELATTLTLADRVNNLGSLSLEAGNNITLDDGSAIKAGQNWSVNLTAGTELSSGADRQPGKDGIYMLGNSYIQSQNGDINLTAGNEVLVNSGESGDVGNNGIRTMNGGNISVTATYGDVNAGGNGQGYSQYRNRRTPYYVVSPTLGGISTAAGGNVTINAGGNVVGYLPSGDSEGGIGAFGPQLGTVSVTAGGSIFGHYIAANGPGSSLSAGGDVGGPDASQNVALSLIKGSWDVSAGGSIYLQEVRNPNGMFNNVGGFNSPAYHLFDYDPAASVTLNAGASVFLTGLNLPRPDGSVPMIFPPELTINAVHDLVLQDTISLFPSANQNLNLNVGGTFRASPNDPQNGAPELIMSDAEKPGSKSSDPWTAKTRWLNAGDFGELDHGAAPITAANPDPVLINVGGNMENVILMTSRETEIAVHGDMNNCSFSGQNLHPFPGANVSNPHLWGVTSIDVSGQIFNRSPYSFVILDHSIPSLPTADIAPGSHPSWATIFSAALDRAVLATLQVPPNLDPSQWAAYAAHAAALFPAGNPGFVYNSDINRLGFSGQMPESVRNALEQSLTVLRYGPNGYPLLDANRHFITDQVTFTAASAIETLYHASLGAPSVSDAAGLGYAVGGPGEFNVTAHSISLGNTYGILTAGVGDPQGKKRFANLASITPQGASINVTVDDDLNLLTSTIAALGGGDVNVSSLFGSMNLGSQELFNVSRGLALGIYTTGNGNVCVTAYGDIDISGSRIAAYNGGNIKVESLHGNIDCGDGGTAYVTVPTYYVDPKTGLAAFNGEEVFGSGILATTLIDPSKVPDSPILPGNITVKADDGSINASRGGILQDALNGNLSSGPTITLTAHGYDSSSDAGKKKGNIDLGDSGVIGGSVSLNADGKVTGLIISRQNTTVNAGQSFSGTVLSGGTASLSSGGTISGTIIGVSGVQASGAGGVTATLVGSSVSVGGATQATPPPPAPTSTSQAAAQTASDDAKNDTGTDSGGGGGDDKKKGKGPALTRRVGRVTVILPKG